MERGELTEETIQRTCWGLGKHQVMASEVQSLAGAASRSLMKEGHLKGRVWLPPCRWWGTSVAWQYVLIIIHSQGNKD